MEKGPIYVENILDGVKKDLNIENLQMALAQCKELAFGWVPQFSFDTEANDGKSVQFQLVVGDKSNPSQLQGVTYTLSKEDVIYLHNGNSLVDNIADNLGTLYIALLKNEIRNRIKYLAVNIAKQENLK